MEVTSKGSMLVLVVELDTLVNTALNHAARGTQEAMDIIQKAISSMIVYCSSYSLMHRANGLSVIVCLSRSMRILFPSETSGATNFVPDHYTLSAILADGFQRALDEEMGGEEGDAPEGSAGSLAQSLSSALSIIHGQQAQARILILQFEKDKSQNYSALMNSIFSAQKLHALIDALIVCGFDSHLMQQACFLSGGLYVKHTDLSDLLQILHAYFLADNATRAQFVLPQQKSVDFKASCHCHKEPVEFAYMCSVCLTLYCERSKPTDRCSVCGTESRGAKA
mmetsp:Transcript_30671/g.69549  ORF Transcript_30671/g.69549 Transcript_30671/m.69549 type:complete len:281 (+) Transcript_30671:94-936(+)